LWSARRSRSAAVWIDEQPSELPAAHGSYVESFLPPPGTGSAELRLHVGPQGSSTPVICGHTRATVTALATCLKGLQTHPLYCPAWHRHGPCHRDDRGTRSTSCGRSAGAGRPGQGMSPVTLCPRRRRRSAQAISLGAQLLGRLPREEPRKGGARVESSCNGSVGGRRKPEKHCVD
jgi:hypothetical protein